MTEQNGTSTGTRLRPAKILGIISFGIVELIIIVSAIFVFIDIINSGIKADLLSLVIYSALGVHGVVWGSQVPVNYAKNRKSKIIKYMGGGGNG